MLLERCHYKLSEDVLNVETAGEHVLMDYGSGMYFGVRGAFRVLVEPLRQGMSVPQMVQAVSQHFAVSPSVAEGDLLNILPRLLEAGLIHAVQPS